MERVFSPDEVAAMRAEADDLLATILNSSAAQGRTSGRLDWRRNSGGLQMVAQAGFFMIFHVLVVHNSYAQDVRLAAPPDDLQSPPGFL
jgi:hypothetical protein